MENAIFRTLTLQPKWKINLNVRGTGGMINYLLGSVPEMLRHWEEGISIRATGKGEITWYQSLIIPLFDWIPGKSLSSEKKNYKNRIKINMPQIWHWILELLANDAALWKFHFSLFSMLRKLLLSKGSNRFLTNANWENFR